MKVFILAYARKNLGDDIFIKMLLEKYSAIDFYIKIKDKNFLDQFNHYKNLNILISEDTDEELYKMHVLEYDAYVYIGGSIFIEGGQVYNLSPKFYDFMQRCNKMDIPFCYISCNYGPYQTKEYFELSKNNFELCTDICFRDKYSYNLFKDISSVRYAPDYAFSYDIKPQEKIANTIGISIINLNLREQLKEYHHVYSNVLINNIKQYIKSNNTVYLFSFCKHEGDEDTIEDILRYFRGNPRVKSIKYDGNIDKFLETYGKMQYMICARFHSVILSSLFRQKIFVMSYSSKIDCVIDDLELNLPILQLKDIKEDLKIKPENFKTVDEQKMIRIIEQSKEQHKVLEKVLKDVK